MPKLSNEELEARREKIEEAAKVLFIKRGFHGTSMRDIAAEAGVSLGNLYNYYRTKEELLESLILRYQQTVTEKINKIYEEVEEPLLPANLARFGHLVRMLVEEHYDYWLLMYIDVLEFENCHFRKMFEGLTDKLRRRFDKHFRELEAKGLINPGIDPALGFSVAYLQFFNYFLIEKLFGGNHHLGITDSQAIERLCEIFCRGILSPETSRRYYETCCDSRYRDLRASTHLDQ
ncbi:MAG: TetR/AcrR family transcriptional regulator [Acidobacteriota bacterium]|nr:TetR/AcrR family transcriptional regulator [Blastocatellia bacterium]MDW8413664.1 TetR/AcrR family transcriptional regulator [Acidobacteriota bacterium]